LLSGLLKKIDSSSAALVRVMEEDHATEEAFDTQLFLAIAESFQRAGWTIEMLPSDVDKGMKKYIVLQKPPRGCGTCVEAVGEMEYAMGLSRRTGLESHETSPFKGQPFPDHSWVIFKKRKRKRENDGGRDDCSDWVFHRVLATVELKMDESTCRSYELDESSSGVDLQSFEKNVKEYGPLLQEVLYVFAHVIPDRASLGLELQPKVPLAVIAGKKGSSSQMSRRDRARWTHGNIVTPSVCGGRFSFDVDGFGGFNEDGSAAAAVSAYLRVMRNGMEAAEEWFELLRATSAEPRSVCGREVQYGKSPLNVALLASPRIFVSKAFRASQCELFTLKDELSSVRIANPCGTEQVFWCHERPGGENDVIVKVSSKACFGHLTSNGLFWSMGRLTWTAIQNLLSPSLYGVYVLPRRTGMVQLMPDLSKEGFKELCPKDLTDDSSWKSMWGAFKTLVQGTLVPLARQEIIHVDLRHGFDRTANILFDGIRMLVIDWDSLMKFKDWEANPPTGEKYIESDVPSGRRDRTSALEYVFLQTVCIVECWIRGRESSKASPPLQKKARGEGEPAPRAATAEALIRGSELARRWEENLDATCDEEFIDGALRNMGLKFEPASAPPLLRPAASSSDGPGGEAE
jgi:hypothetical protein